MSNLQVHEPNVFKSQQKQNKHNFSFNFVIFFELILNLSLNLQQ